MRIEAERELIAAPEDVWQLLSDPYHLSDWWPGYTAVRPDRRGLAEGARWQVARGTNPRLLRRSGGEGIILVTAVEPPFRLGWRDLQQRFDAEITLELGPDGHTRARLFVEAPWWRLIVEELRPTPPRALARLHALCQTAATL